jgi:hypothetical protein
VAIPVAPLPPTSKGRLHCKNAPLNQAPIAPPGILVHWPSVWVAGLPQVDQKKGSQKIVNAAASIRG